MSPPAGAEEELHLPTVCLDYLLLVPQKWWTTNVTANVKVDCSKEDLERFLERVLSIHRYEMLEGEKTTTDYGPVSVLLMRMHQ